MMDVVRRSQRDPESMYERLSNMNSSHGWFDVVEFPNGVTMIAEPGHYEDVKSFVVEGDERVAVLDTGMGFGDFKALADSLSTKPPVVLLSHAHFDHIGDAWKYDDVRVHPAEADDLRAGYPLERMRRWFDDEYMRDIPLPEETDPETAYIPGKNPSNELNEGDMIDLGGRALRVYHTPGHSPGGVTLIDEVHRLMFPGDAIYAGPMFAHNDYGDPLAYRESLRRLAELAQDVDVVYPSHNRVPLAPADVVAMHDAYEEIFSGREPDERRDTCDVHDFGEFSFWMPPGFNASEAG
jgi:glyoxylase-like metal-dependent hydrolase (beta-lactamase superfamily II)